MAVVLRFQRLGRPKKPFYRLVAVHKRYKRDGESIEILGSYDPKGVKPTQMNEEGIARWLAQGAQASDSVRTTLKKMGLWQKLTPKKSAA